jgi:hypothetical protein
MLVTRYHGVWTTVSAFNETPVIADVIDDLRTVLGRVPVPIGLDEPRRHGIASANAICPSKPSLFAMSR